MDTIVVRPFEDADLPEVVALFLACEPALNMGIELNDEAMRVVGEKYCAAQIGEHGDLNSVAALRRVFFASAAAAAAAAPPPPSGSAPSPVDQPATSTGHFWVAVDTARAVGDRVCGQVALQDKGDGAGELRRMAVRAEYRRLAIGTALVSTLLAHARACGLRRVFLSTPAANERAVRFYTQRCGFAIERHYPLPLEYCFSPEHRMDLVELGIAL